MIRLFCRFEAGDTARSSMNALACVIRITRISMGGRGKVVRNAAIFGHHKIINSMRRTQSIGLDIEKEGERCQKGPNPEHSKCCPEGAFRHPRAGDDIIPPFLKRDFKYTTGNWIIFSN